MKATHHFSERRTGLKMACAAILAVAGLNLQAAVSNSSYETPAYIDFELGEYTVSEEATEISVVVHRTGEFRESFTLHYETLEETASQGRDYKGTGGTLVFKPMESFKTIKVGILSDDLEEAVETFRIQLSSTEPKAFFVRDSATISIQDAPAAPPVLKVRTGAPGSIILSWSGGDNCLLERASGLKGSKWEPVEAEVTMNGSECEVAQAATGQVYLYRLRRN